MHTLSSFDSNYPVFNPPRQNNLFTSWETLLWPESSMQGEGPRVADLGAWCMGLGPRIIIYIRIIGYCRVSFLFLEELYIDEL